MTNVRIVALTYKTFSAAPSVVHEAAVDVLKHMGMRVLPDGSPQEAGVASILASGWRRQLHVELEFAGVAGTRARVLAKDGILFEDNAASDFIAQVERRLEQGRRVAPIARTTREKLSVDIVSAAPEPVAVAG
jgi:hypothetical protein